MEDINFKVGDKVTYKSNIRQLRKYGEVFMNTDMFRLRGQVLEIAELKTKIIKVGNKDVEIPIIKCKDHTWDFSPLMFDLVEPAEVAENTEETSNTEEIEVK